EEFRDVFARETVQQRDVAVERWLDDLASDSALRLESFLQSAASFPGPNAISNELRLDAADALFELPAEEREAVIGHDLEGKSLQKLAQELGVGKTQVARRLAAGRQRLCDLLAGHP